MLHKVRATKGAKDIRSINCVCEQENCTKPRKQRPQSFEATLLRKKECREIDEIEQKEQKRVILLQLQIRIIFYLQILWQHVKSSSQPWPQDKLSVKTQTSR